MGPSSDPQNHDDLPPVLALREAYALPSSSLHPSPIAPQAHVPFSHPVGNLMRDPSASSSKPTQYPHLGHLPLPKSGPQAQLGDDLSATVRVFAPQRILPDVVAEHLARFGSVVSGPSPVPDQPNTFSVTFDSPAAAQSAVAGGSFLVPVGVMKPASPASNPQSHAGIGLGPGHGLSPLSAQNSNPSNSDPFAFRSTDHGPRHQHPNGSAYLRKPQVDKVPSSASLFRTADQSRASAQAISELQAKGQGRANTQVTNAKPIQGWFGSIVQSLLQFFGMI
ncbi:hypothetical protein BCR44DRAFT_29723 [Catenaria anguillulae PL171]|uniref:Uncharacterized protein n=1 Tax=Catenaria anguillulae PL171 TaxID=765915 RepID=A0A1Y2HI73_9FUNG|nr:hypothetical protein BCR44DRAFT_29723 [Catenaria anguillulae PL171]